MAALKRMSVPTVRVRRDGRVQEISSRDLVPGDVVLLETGNVVPADGRVLESVNLRAQEAALTGESEAVEKDGGRSSSRRSGRWPSAATWSTRAPSSPTATARCVVTATGMATELGKIADLIQSVEEEKTPLQKRLDRLGRGLAIAAGVLVVVVFLLGVLRRRGLREEMLLTAVSLAVAADSGGDDGGRHHRPLARRAAHAQAPGADPQAAGGRDARLGQRHLLGQDRDADPEPDDGDGARRRQPPDRPRPARGGRSRFSLERVGARAGRSRSSLPTLDLLLVGGALCNDARARDRRASRRDARQAYHAVGDPTEGALVLAAAEYGIRKDDLDRALPRVAELPFDSVRKRMTTVHRVPRDDAEIPAAPGAALGAARPRPADARLPGRDQGRRRRSAATSVRERLGRGAARAARRRAGAHG